MKITKISLLIFALIAGSPKVFPSELECRSKTAFLLADMKAEYDGYIPNEAIAFAKDAVLRMCLTMNPSLPVVIKPDDSSKTGEVTSKVSKRKPFLGITFGNPGRKEGNKRLLNKK